MRCSALQCVAVLCNVLRCVVVCCSALHCAAVHCSVHSHKSPQERSGVYAQCGHFVRVIDSNSHSDFLLFVSTMYEHKKLPAKLLDYFLRSNKSNINQILIHILRVCIQASCLRHLPQSL